jgi:phage head maturation protease
MADPKKPYGDVTYADPGYKDGTKRYPIDTEAHAKAAWSRINDPANASGYTADQLSQIKSRIKAALKKFGVDVADDGKPSSRADAAADTERQQSDQPWVDTNPIAFCRSYLLEDWSVRSGGDGRTVDAYAAVFDVPVPIRDHEGEYTEIIDRGAFDRAVKFAQPTADREAWRVGVFYNHAMTLHGTPSESGSMPIGVPLEIKPDARGLFTRTRYLDDKILELIKAGALNAYSFSGSFQRSTPMPPPGGKFSRNRRSGELPTVRRMQSTLREYGPTPSPAYQESVILGVRSAEQAMTMLSSMDPAERSRLAELISAGAMPATSGTPANAGLVAEDSSRLGHSGRSIKEQMTARMADFLQTHPEGTPV